MPKTITIEFRGQKHEMTILDEQELEILVVEGPICPKCGQPEVLLGGTVRPFKVHDGKNWKSHCLQCNYWF